MMVSCRALILDHVVRGNSSVADSRLQARARRERTSVGRLVKRLIADGLQEVDDYEAIKAFRRHRGRTVALADVKKRLGLDRPLGL